jgi:hypothetical protein
MLNYPAYLTTQRQVRAPLWLEPIAVATGFWI